MIANDLDAIPEFLTAQSRWVLWRTITRKGKATKAPYTIANTFASSTEPRTWEAFTKVADVLHRNPKLFDGVGFNLGDLGAGEHAGGADLDSCLDDNGDIAEWAQPLVAELRTYMEISPSETGLKAFFRCKAKDAAELRAAFGIAANQWGSKRSVTSAANGKEHGPAIEIYLGPGRYFTVTGKHWPASPEDVVLLDHAALLRLAELVSKATATAKDGRPGRDNSRSAVAFRLAAKLFREDASITFDQICAALRDHPDTAEWCREKGDANDARELRNIWNKISSALVLSPLSPLDSAREWLKRSYTADDGRTLQHQQSTFYHWAGASYIEMPHESMRASVYAFLDKAHIETKDGLVPFKPNTKSVNNIIDATAAAAQLPVNTQAPTWLDGQPHVEPSEVLAFTNGLLHLPTRRMRAHTPLFFNLNAVDYRYDPKAPKPTRWLEFLKSLWESDQQSIVLLSRKTAM